jgi:hypothetical protein
MDSPKGPLRMVFGGDCDGFARLFVLDSNVGDHHKDGVKENSKVLNTYFWPVNTPRGHCTIPSVLVSARCGRTACIFRACSSAKWKNLRTRQPLALGFIPCQVSNTKRNPRKQLEER